MQELASYVKAHSQTGTPYLLMGDFNIPGPLIRGVKKHDEYDAMVNLLTIENFRIIDLSIDTVDGQIAEGTSDATDEGGGRRIDYILLGLPTSTPTNWKAASRTYRFLDEHVDGGSLSDHAAIWARLSFEKSSNSGTDDVK